MTQPPDEPGHTGRAGRGVFLVVAVLLGAMAFSAGWVVGSVQASRQGEPFEVAAATWLRDRNMAWLVARMENVYFRTVARAPVGGAPLISADVAAEDAIDFPEEEITVIEVEPESEVALDSMSDPVVEPVVEVRARLEPPDALVSPVVNPEPKEGVWQAVGSKVDGERAIWVTRVRADDIHTSAYASVMWIDTELAKAMFVPGFEEPAGGPAPTNGQLPKELHRDVLASTNGGFRLADSLGGYYFDGKMVKPLVDGKASAVFTKDGRLRIAKWGRDATLDDDVVAVRQNLDLIVDKGVSKVSNPEDNIVWGATTDKEVLTWRAAIGERPDGSLIYVVGPYMTAKGLADTLVNAGVERAMVVDMNKYWAAGFYYRHKKGVPQCRKLHPEIPDNCDRFLRPFKRDSFHFLANR